MLTIASGISGLRWVSETTQISMSLLFKSASSATAARTRFLVLARLQIFVNKNLRTANSELDLLVVGSTCLAIGTRFALAMSFTGRLSAFQLLVSSLLLEILTGILHRQPPRDPLYLKMPNNVKDWSAEGLTEHRYRRRIFSKPTREYVVLLVLFTCRFGLSSWSVLSLIISPGPGSLSTSI